MTVFRHPKGKTFRYDFWWRGDRYTGNTHQTTQADAAIVESDLKKKLRLQAGGLAPPDTVVSPRFQDWAEIYLDDVIENRSGAIKRPDRIADLLRVVLRFWGARPPATATGKFAAVEGEPYHDLRLSAPIDDPYWIVRFEAWMKARDVKGQTRNQYRSTLSQLYWFALRPEYRLRSGVPRNPFVGVPRDRSVERTSTVTIEELRAWLQHASYYVRLAVSIAALAPELRLANVLALEWKKHIDLERRLITVSTHKTDDATGRPLVVPIDEQLLAILEDARRRHRGKHVIVYRGRPVKSIRGGVRAAAEDAGLSWGRFDTEGVTFHTIRHTMATRLAELSDLDGEAPLSESQRKDAMGHKRLETTQRYTHIRPTLKRRALERLSDVTPIADLVTVARMRAVRLKKKKTGKTTGTSDRGKRKSPMNADKSAAAARTVEKAG